MPSLVPLVKNESISISLTPDLIGGLSICPWLSRISNVSSSAWRRLWFQLSRALRAQEAPVAEEHRWRGKRGLRLDVICPNRGKFRVLSPTDREGIVLTTTNAMSKCYGPQKEKVKERSSRLKDEGKKIHHFEAWMLRHHLHWCGPAMPFPHLQQIWFPPFIFFTNLCRFEQEVDLELLITRLSCKKHLKCFRESQETPDIHIKIPNIKPLTPFLRYAVCILCANNLYALNTWHICQTVQ